MNAQAHGASAKGKLPALYRPPRFARFIEPRQRLAAEIARTLTEFDQRKSVQTSSWWERGNVLALEAQSALEQGHREAAWDLLLDSRRCLVPLLSKDAQAALARSLRAGATNIRRWRRDAMESLLRLDPPGGMALMEAQCHLDTANTNRLREFRSRRIERTILLSILMASLVGILTTLLVGPDVDFGIVTFNNPRLVLLVVFFGVVGASLSALQRSSRRPRVPVPDQRAAGVVSIVRSISGAGTALVILAAAQAGLLGEQAGSVLIAAFAAGFSERFVLRFIPDVKDDDERDAASVDDRPQRSPDLEVALSPGVPRSTDERPGGSRDRPSGYFRASVGAAVLDEAGRVLVFERSDHPGSWQLPQGGVEASESPFEAVLRELMEETGLAKGELDLAAMLPAWLTYELPAELRSRKTGLGQTQRWFVFRLKDSAAKIRLHSTAAPAEFVSWNWVAPAELADRAAPFRRSVYQEVTRAIEQLDPVSPEAPPLG